MKILSKILVFVTITTMIITTNALASQSWYPSDGGFVTRVLTKGPFTTGEEQDLYEDKEVKGKKGIVRLYSSGGKNVYFKFENIQSSGDKIWSSTNYGSHTDTKSCIEIGLDCKNADAGTNNASLHLWHQRNVLVDVQVCYARQLN